jgi:glycosyltransferase involved in cell wall biosynthesis
MRRLVFVTQQVDPASPVLAATVPKVAALADRVDEVAVLALAGLDEALPPNVRVRRFGAPRKAMRGVRFEAALAAELRRRPRPLAIVAHMCPIYAVLAAPLARALRVPLLLWYTHWRDNGLLRLSERLVDRVISVDVRTFPFPSPKLRGIGHGIDVERWPCLEPPANPTLRVLMVGRYSHPKGVHVAVQALRLLLDRGADAALHAYGPAGNRAERAYREELDGVVASLGLAGAARLHGPVPHERLPELLARSDVLVNPTRAGATDKIVYEAAASCVPVLASNVAFDGLFVGIEPGLAFAEGDPASLADGLERLVATSREERARIGRELRRRVAGGHSVASWAERVLATAAEVQ